MIALFGNRTLTLRLIGVFKLFKGVILLIVGLGALRLLHHDAAFEIERWADAFRVDQRSHHLYWLVNRVSNIDPRKLRAFSFGTFFYSSLLLTEGFGLLTLQAWAEYFTLITTASLLPLEIFELSKRATWPRALVLVLNIAVVIYLIFEVQRRRR